VTVQTKVNELEQVAPETYPCLKISGEGRVVLFTGPRQGVFLHGRSYTVGETSDTWTEDSFRLLRGSITLSNDF
jgi:hypothetical protein